MKKLILALLLSAPLTQCMLPILQKSTEIAEVCVEGNKRFFDMSDNYKLNDYYIIAMKARNEISSLFLTTMQLYKDGDESTMKYVHIGAMLFFAMKMIDEYIDVIKSEYSTVISISFAFKKMISNIKKNNYIDKLYDAMIYLEVALSDDELDNFYRLKDLIESIKSPSIRTCLKALKKYV